MSDNTQRESAASESTTAVDDANDVAVEDAPASAPADDPTPSTTESAPESATTAAPGPGGKADTGGDGDGDGDGTDAAADQDTTEAAVTAEDVGSKSATEAKTETEVVEAKAETAAIETETEVVGAEADKPAKATKPAKAESAEKAGRAERFGTAGTPGVTAREAAEEAVQSASEQGGVRMTVPQEQQAQQAPTVRATKASRKAHLTVGRVEPWSVMKFSFVIALVCFIILFVAIAVMYAILSSLGVFDALTDLIASLTDGGEGDDLSLNPESWFSPTRVLGYTGLIGALNIILITALSTVGAMLYNLAADLVGGIDVTLTESE